MDDWPKELQDENGHLDYKKFGDSIKAMLEKTTLRDPALRDFDSSGYGPSAMIRYWQLFDAVCKENKRLKLAVGKDA